MFSFISMNWRAKPLVSYRVIVDLISATTTDTGPTVRCELDTNTCPKGITVSKQEMNAINITRADFHGNWNDTIRPTNGIDIPATVCRPWRLTPCKRASQPVRSPSDRCGQFNAEIAEVRSDTIQSRAPA